MNARKLVSLRDFYCKDEKGAYYHRYCLWFYYAAIM